MAPKTPKSAKRTEKEPLEKDAAPKVAKEDAEQTPGAAEQPKISDALGKTSAVEAEPIKGAVEEKGAEATPDVKEAEEPVKAAVGDGVAAGSDKTPATNGTATNEAEKPAEATAVGVEAGATKKLEQPQAAKEGEKVVEAGIAEAKPVSETE